MITVAASGTGRTLANLICQGIQVSKVFSTSAKAGVVQVANSLGVPCEILPKDPLLASEKILTSDDHFVVLGGYLRKITILPGWENRVVNIHPSLLPAFCGMHGENIHREVLRRGCKVTGCTVHFCDNEYDTGPIIAQTPVFVEDGDTVETLGSRVFAAECELLPKTMKMLLGKS